MMYGWNGEVLSGISSYEITNGQQTEYTHSRLLFVREEKYLDQHMSAALHLL